MPIYTEGQVGPGQSTLQDFLPTPVTFLRDSHALDVASLLFGALVVYAFLHNRTHNKDCVVPRWARYIGMGLAAMLLAAAHWLAIAYRWQLSQVLRTFIKAQLAPVYQWNTVWSSIGLLANVAYWALLLAFLVYLWRARVSLGAGVVRLLRFFTSANERV